MSLKASSMLISAAICGQVLCGSGAMAQVPEGYDIANWKNFSTSAVTYSFDDGTANQIPVAIPLLDKYNFKGSFNLVTDWVKDWSAWKKVADNGHEIASHTVSHKNFGQITEDIQEQELRDSKQIIEKNIGRECITMVYPYCARGNDNIVAKYYISARSCSGHIENPKPQNMFDITSLGVGTESQTNSAKAFNDWVDNGVSQNGWAVFLIHAIDNDGGYSPINSSDFEQHLKYVSSNPQKFWVATFAQVSKYILERNSLNIKEKVTKKAVDVTVTCTDKTEITKLDEPITISRKLPDGWTTAKVKCGQQQVESKIKDNKLIFNVIPGNNYKIVK